MQLATWNVNSLAVRLPQLLEWLAAHPVDAIVLQETKLTDTFQAPSSCRRSREPDSGSDPCWESIRR